MRCRVSDVLRAVSRLDEGRFLVPTFNYRKKHWDLGF